MRKYKPRLWGGAAQGSPADAFLSVLEQELLSSKDAPCSGSNPMHTQLFIALHAGVLLRHLQIMGWRACGFRGKGILKNHQGLPVSQGSFGKPCLLCSCLQALRKPGSALLHALPSEMICEHPGVPSSTRAASLHSHHVSTGTDLLHLPPPACSSSVRQCGCNGSALVPCIPPAPFVSAARGIGAKCIN